MPRQSFDLKAITRPNIWALHPYRCARDDYSEGVLLDANENSIGPVLLDNNSLKAANGTATTNGNGTANGHSGSGDALAVLASSRPAGFPVAQPDSALNRYPDPHQEDTKQLLVKFRGLPYGPECLFVGVGSDESIDLIMRCFCVPAKDKILICPPTYGMYTVAANTNDVGIVKVPLNVESEGEDRYQLQVEKVGREKRQAGVRMPSVVELTSPILSCGPPQIKEAIRNDPDIKLVILCSPGNPTGIALRYADIKAILDFEEYKGIVVVDEAYIDFTPASSTDRGSVATWIKDYPNLIVTQTLSKGFGLAGIR